MTVEMKAFAHAAVSLSISLKGTDSDVCEICRGVYSGAGHIKDLCQILG